MLESIFNRIAIVGVGLIGGSWGLALKKYGNRAARIGCDRLDVLKAALACKAIDEAEEDLRRAVAGADLVILAAPVGAILDALPIVGRAVPEHALVTDVGSVKFVIMERAREVFGSLFLGGHPLAGKERSGIEHADGSLFENARYALVPQKENDLQDGRAQAFVKLLDSFKARPWVTDAATHDHAVAFLSHLPQLASTGLASLIQEQQERSPLPLELAATGFRDSIRLAESPYAVWRDICHANSRNITEALDALIEKLQTIKQHLQDDELGRDFDQAAKLVRTAGRRQ
jgi:prephenate dehydrogenase